MKVIGQFEHNVLPDLETERLVLRQRTLNDVNDMFAYASLAEVANSAGFKRSETLQDSYEFLTLWHKRMTDFDIPKGYGITLKGSDKVIGSVDFNRRYGKQQHILDLGYVLHPHYWGQGIVVEAARALMTVTFLLLPDIYKIGVSHYAFNQQSRRVIEKLGFIYEGTMRSTYQLNGCFYDELQYGILREEWHKKNVNK